MIRFLVSSLALTLLAVPGVAQEEAAAPATRQDPEREKSEKPEKPEVLELGGTLGRAVALPDIDGEVLNSRELAGKIVVVNFWATRCPIMQGWEDRYAAIHREFSEKGVAFVTINSNATNGELSKEGVRGRAPVEPTEEEAEQPYPEIRAVLREKKLPYRVLVDADSRIANLFGAKTTPDIFVFDREGTLVYRGLIDDDLRQRKGADAKHHLRDVLDTLLDDEAELEPYETRPHGCSIKRPKQPAAEGEKSGERQRRRRR